jgi:hypothetical protein
MVWGLIFKENTMKYYIIIIFLLWAIPLFIACDDSLGYDPNVKIQKIDDGTQDDNNGNDTSDSDNDPPVNTKYRIDSVKYEFTELHNFQDDYEKRINWEFSTRNNVVSIDTGEVNPELWIYFDLVNTNGSDIFYKSKGFTERVLSVNLSFSALLESQLYRLNDSYRDTRWIELEVKDIPHQRTYKLDGSKVPSYIIVNGNDKEKGLLSLFIVVEMWESHRKYRKFTGNLLLYYKDI